MKYYRGIWLAIYIFSNLIAAAIFAISGQLDGDLIGIELPDHHILVVATIFVISSYLLWMGPVFNIMASVVVSPFIIRREYRDIIREEWNMGVFVLLVQFFFMVFNYQEGVNVAGSRLQSDSAIRYLWILLPADALFLIYYGLHRKSRLFWPNLALYLISNVLRGWLSAWLFIFFIEGAYRLQEGRLNWRKVLVVLAIFYPLLPVLVELKWLIRELGMSGILNFDEVHSRLLSFVINADWWESISESTRSILMRFQHLSLVIGIIDNANILTSGLANREFLYFFEEGVPQYTLARIFGISIVPDIHIMLLTYLVPERLYIDTITNTHVGLVGWFWISSSLLPFYLLYLLILSWIGMWLARKIGGDLLINVIWFSWLIYLMNGWFGAYIQFLQALVLLMCFRIFTTRARWWLLHQ